MTLHLSVWYDAAPDHWVITVWVCDNGTIDPENDRAMSLAETYGARDTAYYAAREIQDQLRDAGYDCKLDPIRPKRLEDEHDEYLSSVDGLIQRLDADRHRRLAVAMMKVLPVDRWYGAVRALEMRL